MGATDIGNISTYKTSDGSGWMAQITIGQYPNGKTKYKRFRGKKKREVLDKAKSYKAKNLGIVDPTETYLEDYLNYYVKQIKKQTLKCTSYTREVRTMELHINPYIGHYHISQLSTSVIQNELISRLVKDGRSYSSIHKAFILVKACLNYAILNGKINFNPCEGVVKPSKINLPSKPIRFLTENELGLLKSQALLMHKTGRPRYKYGIPILLVAYTGLRVGELCALKWSDIDYKNKTLKVFKNIAIFYEENETDEENEESETVNTKTKPNKKKRKIIEQETAKTSNSERFIPLNQRAIELLLQLEKTNGGNPSFYIISGGTTPISIDTVSKCYTSIATSANISNPQGVHTLRHTFASMLIKKGVDIKIVSEILGHANITITYNLYVHIILEQKAKAIDMIDF